MGLSSEERIDRLETTVALQDNVLEKLSAAYGEQQMQLHRLEQEIERLRKQVAQMEPSKIRDAADEEPPPHY